jgi:hypothetical protein
MRDLLPYFAMLFSGICIGYVGGFFMGSYVLPKRTASTVATSAGGKDE